MKVFTEQVMQNLLQAITIMWQGMLGIFVVIGIIAAMVYLVSKRDQSAK